MDYNSLKMEQLGSVRDMFGLKGKKALVTGLQEGLDEAVPMPLRNWGRMWR